MNNNHPNLLIVDDNEKNLYSSKRVLSDCDINIHTALSGEEALKMLLSHEYFLILMDVQMPEMNGFETVSFIRGNKNFENIPIIYLTAISQDEKYIQEGYESGAVDYLCKPITPYTLTAKVHIFLKLYLNKKALEQRTEEVERSNKEMLEFSYIVSHDLQEPLRMIASYTQLLEKRYKNKLDDDANEFIHYIVDGATRMQSLIQALLSYSRIDTQEKTLIPTTLDDAFNWAIANLELAISDSGALITHDPLPRVIGDVGQLGQLMQNLIGNAIKFRGEHSLKIHIGAEISTEKNNLGECWKISVVDNGIGIDKAFQERIFLIFQRLHSREKYEGTGIGLSVCKKIVERHGGKINVSSNDSEGSTFSFTLPSAPSEPSSPE